MRAINKAERDEIERLLSIGMTIEDICDFFEWDTEEFYKTAEKDSSLKKRIKKGVANGKAIIYNTLHEEALKGNLKAVELLMKTVKPSWNDISETSSNNTEMVPFSALEIVLKS